MRSLPFPALATSDVVALCASGTLDIDLRDRLVATKPDLVSASDGYDILARAERLDMVTRVLTLGSLTNDELKDLYSQHLSSTSGSARTVYDQIRNAAPNKKCPLCGVGTVAVLDHHLPKAKYPNLSVAPANLVPACHYCNDTKKARFPKHAGEQTLHPYYDSRLLERRWVKAEIQYGTPITISFSASPPLSWSPTDQQRCQRHFKICGLGVVFASNANDDLSILKDTVKSLYERGGAVPVSSYLAEQALRYISRPNSWQFSMYEVLSSDSWFTNGGFSSIA